MRSCTIFLALFVWPVWGHCDALKSARGATVVIYAEFTNPDTGAVVERVGTGVVISEDGYLLTSKHVVAQPGRASQDDVYASPILGATGSRSAAREPLELIKVHPTVDAALLKFQNTFGHRTHVRRGNPSAIEDRDKVFFLGTAGAEEWISTDGKLVGKNGPEGSWNVDMSFGPGSSGGPILNECGELIAIAWGAIRQEPIDGLHRVLPINLYDDLLNTAGARRTDEPCVETEVTGLDDATSGLATQQGSVSRQLIIDELLAAYKAVGWKVAFFKSWGGSTTRHTLRISERNLSVTSPDGLRNVSISVDPVLLPESVHYAASIGHSSGLSAKEAAPVASFFASYNIFRKSLERLIAQDSDFDVSFIDATSTAATTMAKGRDSICALGMKPPLLFPDGGFAEPVPPNCSKSPFE